MFMLRVTIMPLIFLYSKQDILIPGFTIDAEHVDKTYKNNPNVQPGPESNKSNDEKPSWRDGESRDPGTDTTSAPKSSATSADDIPATQPSDSLYVSTLMLSVFFLICEGYFIWLHLHAHDWPLNLHIHGMYFNAKTRKMLSSKIFSFGKIWLIHVQYLLWSSFVFSSPVLWLFLCLLKTSIVWFNLSIILFIFSF